MSLFLIVGSFQGDWAAQRHQTGAAMATRIALLPFPEEYRTRAPK
jgi:hypothetical protein